MAFEFKITNTLTPYDLSHFGPLIKGRVALVNSSNANDGIKGVFILDTGASSSAIDQSVADDLGLKPVRTIPGHGMAGQSEIQCYSVKIFIPAQPLLVSLPAGAVAALGIPQEVGSIKGLHQGHESVLGTPPDRIIGLLGRSFMQFTKTTYDGLTGKITIEVDQAMRDPKFDGPLPATLPQF